MSTSTATPAPAAKVELTEKQIIAAKAARTKAKLDACPVTATLQTPVPFDEKARTGRNRVFIEMTDEVRGLLHPTRPHVDAKPAIEAALRKAGYRYDYLGWNPNAGGKGVAGFTMDDQSKGRKNVTLTVTLEGKPVEAAPEPEVVEAAAAEADAEVEAEVEETGTVEEVESGEVEAEAPATPELVDSDSDEA